MFIFIYISYPLILKLKRCLCNLYTHLEYHLQVYRIPQGACPSSLNRYEITPAVLSYLTVHYTHGVCSNVRHVCKSGSIKDRDGLRMPYEALLTHSSISVDEPNCNGWGKPRAVVEWKLLGRRGGLLRERSRMGDSAWKCTGVEPWLIQFLLSYTAMGARKGLLCGRPWVQIPGLRLSL